jgi:hypothetical protein
MALASFAYRFLYVFKRKKERVERKPLGECQQSKQQLETESIASARWFLCDGNCNRVSSSSETRMCTFFAVTSNGWNKITKEVICISLCNRQLLFFKWSSLNENVIDDNVNSRWGMAGDVSGTRQIHLTVSNIKRSCHRQMEKEGNDVSVYFHSFLLCQVSCGSVWALVIDSTHPTRTAWVLRPSADFISGINCGRSSAYKNQRDQRSRCPLTCKQMEVISFLPATLQHILS